MNRLKWQMNPKKKHKMICDLYLIMMRLHGPLTVLGRGIARDWIINQLLIYKRGNEVGAHISKKGKSKIESEKRKKQNCAVNHTVVWEVGLIRSGSVYLR